MITLTTSPIPLKVRSPGGTIRFLTADASPDVTITGRILLGDDAVTNSTLRVGIGNTPGTANGSPRLVVGSWPFLGAAASTMLQVNLNGVQTASTTSKSGFAFTGTYDTGAFNLTLATGGFVGVNSSPIVVGSGLITRFIAMKAGLGAGSGGSPSNITNASMFEASSLTSVDVSTTITNTRGLAVRDIGHSTVTNAYGIDIDAQTASGTTIGLRIALPTGTTAYALQLSDAGGTAAGGITFGTDVQLYRSAANVLKLDDAFSLVGKISTYNNITTVGWGVPSVYGTGRSTAQTGDVASVATYTVGGADGSFFISANFNVTAYTAGTQAVKCDYTDETNTARTFTFTFSNLTGTLATAIGATGPYESFPAHIRCKASTAITIKTTGTAWTGTYNVEGYITQIG